MSWPDGGPWVVAATSTGTAWEVAAAALAAASAVPVAAVRIVGDDQGRDAAVALLRDNLAGYAEVRVTGSDPVRLDDVVTMVEELTRTHGLVLVGGDLGLVMPLDGDGRSLADLASVLRAPVVVVTGPGPDAQNHRTLALAVLSARGLTAAVVAVGDLDGAPFGCVVLAGRIPADVAEQPEGFRAAVAGTLDPMLHASRGGVTDAAAPKSAAPKSAAPKSAAPKSAAPEAVVPGGTGAATDAGAAYDETVVRFEEAVAGLTLTPPRGRPWRRRTVTGKRIAVGLIAFTVLLVAVLGGVAVRGSRPAQPDEGAGAVRIGDPGPRGGAVLADSRPDETADEWPAQDAELDPDTGTAPSEVCPQSAGNVALTVPTATTTARVVVAWKRIETWLAANAPATRAALGTPASAAEVAAVQRRMSVAFPPDLVASLLRHNGSTGRDSFSLPPFYELLPTAQILVEWTVACSILTTSSDMGDDYWSMQYVPVGRPPDSGALVLDQRPGGHGRVGEFYPEDSTTFAGWPASFVGFLEGIATSMESGAPYAGRYLPQVTDNGALRWRVL